MKALVFAVFACVLMPVLALAQEGQGQAPLNSITGVNVKGGTVEIVGTKKPHFTTFTLPEPFRLVIDISEATLSGVKEDITVGNGTISGIRTASYGSDETAIARVVIGYERDVETDIQATGNSLVVSVVGGGGAAVAAASPAAPGEVAGKATPATPGGTEEQATVAAQADQKQQAAAAAQATTATQAEPKQQAAQATVAAQADQKQQERATAQAAAAAQTDAEAQRQAQASAVAERKAQEESARVAARQAEQTRLADERAAREATAVAEKQRREDMARVTVSSRGKWMTMVGFKQEPTASRVFVRTNEPVTFNVTEGDKLVVLELENTRIDMENNGRRLDTSFFDTSVASVDADAGPSRTVRVAIQLKEQVSYQTRQDGNELSIEFQRPARR
jgi:hypothetical protein